MWIENLPIAGQDRIKGSARQRPVQTGGSLAMLVKRSGEYNECQRPRRQGWLGLDKELMSTSS